LAGVAALVAADKSLSFKSRKENEVLIFSFFCIKAKELTKFIL